MQPVCYSLGLSLLNLLLTTTIILSRESYEYGQHRYYASEKIEALRPSCGKLNQENPLLKTIPPAYNCAETRRGRSRCWHESDQDEEEQPVWPYPYPKPYPPDRRRSVRSRRLHSQRLNSRMTLSLSDFPSYVRLALEDREINGTRWRCNGVLVHNNFVLTTAQCLRKKGQNVGILKAYLNDGGNGTLISLGKKVCLMEGYDSGDEDISPEKDMALVEIDPVDTGKPGGPQVACLDFQVRPIKKAICMGVAEGLRKTDIEVIESNEFPKIHGNLVTRNCTGEEEAEEKLGKTCYRHIEAEGYQGNFCMNDRGAPIYCIYHCELGPPRLNVVGLMSYALARNATDLLCDKHYNRSMAFMAMDFFELRGYFLPMLEECSKTNSRRSYLI